MKILPRDLKPENLLYTRKGNWYTRILQPILSVGQMSLGRNFKLGEGLQAS